ncbi:EAL domain-containing protein [Clostridium sp. OS1-26]|uniref:sensor domain-containing protein n=1 Tax=Clostridium sp. OS1-26 TaxID=3070681 RepID=UPI0027E2098A|nr:EAL domain-containing protein [Clostridium sp. OS1-26]WML34140.1 EAL domain-containing protein [Clostridium sp. OS1-26]
MIDTTSLQIEDDSKYKKNVELQYGFICRYMSNDVLVSDESKRVKEIQISRGNISDISIVEQVLCKKDILNLKVWRKKLDYEALEKYKILFEKARDIIFILDLNGKIIDANEAAINSYGYSRNELFNMCIYDLREINNKFLIMEQLAEAKKHGVLFETLHKKKDGTVFSVHVNSQVVTIKGKRILLSIIRDISDRKCMEEKLEYISRHDYLTNIPNRYYLKEFLSKTYSKIKHEKNALLIIDIDNFKVINDSYGHAAGDTILIKTANFIKNKLDENDFFARIGGDEFAIFLPNTPIELAEDFANKLLKSLNAEEFYIEESDYSVKITASIGITKVDEIIQLESLFSSADAALYAAKEEGKNRVIILKSTEDRNKILQNNKILNFIQNALKNNKFTLRFQPIYKTNNVLLHYEVLLRMLDEDGSEILPSLFISVAEKYGLMQSIDMWVVDNSFKILTKEKNLSIFINLSGTSLGNEYLLEWIESRINYYNLDPSRIGFEITETAAIKNLEKANRWVNRLKTLGCKFALDDFGVGFSSFTYLNILPVDYLKIDGSFIRNLDSDTTKIALVQAMNAVAHALGKQTIAEFVENETIWRMLLSMGIDSGQGYYLGKPIFLEDM